MAGWRIYYGDGGVACGSSPQEWRAAPDAGVQAVVLMAPPETPRWTYSTEDGHVSVRDRQLWTGEDAYDPFGWGEKQGSLIDDDAYWTIWERACGDD